MHKLNISGLLKKCKELYSRVADWFLAKLGKKVEEKEEEFVLGPVKEFLEAYIGVCIVGFNTFQEDVPDIEDKIRAKMITNVETEDTTLWVRLSNINGTHGGYIKMSPAINGQFAERATEDEPIWASRYRLKFYGGDSIEYIDPDDAGIITYHAGFRR